MAGTGSARLRRATCRPDAVRTDLGTGIGLADARTMRSNLPPFALTLLLHGMEVPVSQREPVQATRRRSARLLRRIACVAACAMVSAVAASLACWLILWML